MGEFSGDAAGYGVTGRPRIAVRLPPRRSSFVGRTADLGEIAVRLGRYPVVTLTGVGGVGKTALAVEAAWLEVSAGRADLVCFADLVPSSWQGGLRICGFWRRAASRSTSSPNAYGGCSRWLFPARPAFRFGMAGPGHALGTA